MMDRIEEQEFGDAKFLRSHPEAFDDVMETRRGLGLADLFAPITNLIGKVWKSLWGTR